MTPSFSLYLDLVRFVAAAAVLVSHLSAMPYGRGMIWWRLEPLGEVAVTVFFVLSGYVIAHVVRTRETSFRAYASARVARFYSVAIIALALTFVLDSMGRHLSPAFYEAANGELSRAQGGLGYLAGLAFVNEWQVFGFHGISPGSNGPYWSLSFEAAYYVIAGIALFAPWQLAIPAVGLVLVMAGATVAVLLPLWALGFGLYVLRLRKPIPGGMAWPLLAASAIGVVTAPFWVADSSAVSQPVFTFGRGQFPRNVLLDYVVAFLFAMHVLAAKSIFTGQGTRSPFAQGTVRWLGSLTFPLYCMHYPILCLAAAAGATRGSPKSTLALACAAVFAVVWAVTPVCDKLKVTFRRILENAFRAQGS